MADKPRVKAPKRRSTTDAEAAARRRKVMIFAVAAAGLAAVAVGALIVLLGGSGGGTTGAESVRASLEAAGCTLQAVKAQPGVHSLTADGTAKWNTDPPTNGPHHEIAAVFGAYDDALEQARVVHNLEHGGVYIQYGEKVPDSTVEQLRSFYSDHQTGTLLAPLPRLGDEIALGAWVVTDDELQRQEDGHGYLAKCTTFDEAAFSAFFDEFQFTGPERFDPSQLQPGH